MTANSSWFDRSRNAEANDKLSLAGPLPMVAGFSYVAERSRSLNMQSFNRCELIIQLSEAYRRQWGEEGDDCP